MDPKTGGIEFGVNQSITQVRSILSGILLLVDVKI